MSDIGSEINRLGITRLCHFTHLSSFRQIAADENVWSTQVLTEKHPSAAVNDRLRLDGHLTYISCSIQFPNLWVLDAYRANGHRTDEWVVLLLDPKLLSASSTRFSPVNAATSFGAHVTHGLESLVSMFQPRPPSVHNVYRGPLHLKNCPTDNQAEVLVSKAIHSDEIIGVVCMTPEVRQHVDQLVTRWNVPKPVTSVRKFLFDSNYVKQMIWNGYDMDLAIREVSG